MDEIVEKARELAMAIRGSEGYKALVSAEKKLGENAEVRKMMEDFDRQSRMIHEKETALQPVEVEDKRKLQQLHERMQSEPLVQELLRAQADYAQMMAKVNEAIDSNLKPK